MSGIYIPGMEMPTTGIYFVSVDNTGGRDKAVATVERMLGNRDVRQIVGSFELVPVPEHGRLIDADALRHTYYHAPSFPNLCKAINEAPTVIPASKEGEG